MRSPHGLTESISFWVRDHVRLAVGDEYEVTTRFCDNGPGGFSEYQVGLFKNKDNKYRLRVPIKFRGLSADETINNFSMKLENAVASVVDLIRRHDWAFVIPAEVPSGE